MTGDKPIETLGEVGRTALTGTSTVLKQATNAAGLTGTAAPAVEKAVEASTGSACADGSCVEPAPK